MPGNEYLRAIGHYRRHDVADVLAELSRRRPLSLYYWTDRDYRQRDARRRRVTPGCLPDAGALTRVVDEAVARVSDCAEPFYPFFTMGGRAHAPNRPDQAVGWDLTLEADLDLAGSFRALIPLVALFEHVGVPHLAKFSGQRSLHVVLPAEALAPALARAREQPVWFAALAEIGRFLCRIVPALTATWIAVGRDQPLTTPYSFHRYAGRLSLPVDLESAWRFDPAEADPDRFAGPTWRPDDWDAPGEGGRWLLDRARRSERDPEVALALAEELFAGERWRTYRDELADGDPGASAAEDAIHAGPVALGGKPLAERVRRAIAALDDPDVKTQGLQALFGEPGFRADFRLGRREASRALALWATSGLETALRHLLEVVLAQGPPRGRVLRVVRLIAMLPEPSTAHLEAARRAVDERGDLTRALCLVLALAEGGRWRTEDRPDLAVAALCDAFGAARVADWVARPDGGDARLVIDGVFGGQPGKLAFAAGSAGAMRARR